MKLVDKATHPPAKCLISQDIDGPFIDTGTWTGWDASVDDHIYLHPSVVEQAGRLIGMVPEHEVTRLRERLEELEKKYENLDRYREAVEALEEVAV